jgi:hypothetical protein
MPAGVQIAQAIPPLRGTLPGDQRGLRGRLAPEGVTGATSAAKALPPAEPDFPAIIALGFMPGSTDLASADLKPLTKRSAAFLARGGGTIYIDARGSIVEGQGAVRSLENLSLGLRRASAIADVLISLGVPPEHIKLLVSNEIGVSTVGVALAQKPDTAEVTFDPAGH